MGPSPPGVESTGGTGADAGLLSDMKKTIMCIKRHIETSPFLKSSDTTKYNKELTTEQKECVPAVQRQAVFLVTSSNVQLLNSLLNRKKPQSTAYNYLALDIDYLDELHTKLLELVREEECIRNRQIQEQQEEIARLQNRVETYEIERRKYLAEQTAAQTTVQAVDEWIRVGEWINTQYIY